jgi:hypothetical protein
MSVAEDVETQRKGMVLLIYQPAPNAKVCMDRQERESVSTMLEAVPQRTSAVHICIPDNPVSQMLKAVVLISIGQDRRTRTRFHTGNTCCDIFF